MIDDTTALRIARRLDMELAPPSVPRRPLRIGDAIVGWLDDMRATRIARFDDVFTTTADHIVFVPALDTAQRRSDAIASVAATLANNMDVDDLAYRISEIIGQRYQALA